MATSFLFGFTFWIVLFALALIIYGVAFRLYPLHKLPWHLSYRLKEAQRNGDTRLEAHAFAANRFITAGIMLVLIGLSSLLFPNQRFFTLPLAIVFYICIWHNLEPSHH
jgi:hypothetical protein